MLHSTDFYLSIDVSRSPMFKLTHRIIILVLLATVVVWNIPAIATWYYLNFHAEDKVIYQTFQVPYAPHDQIQPKLNLEASLYRAPRPFNRRTLWVNSGGPFKQVDSLEEILKQLPPVIKATHDVIMLDWRLHSNNRLSQALSNQTPERCSAWLKTHASNLGTLASVHDMEYVRQALGIERISLLGYSYGATMLTHYAAMFPERVEAMVLDSPSYVLQTDLIQGLYQKLQWLGKTAQHKFEVLGYDFNQYLDFVQHLDRQDNQVVAADGRRFSLESVLRDMDGFFGIDSSSSEAFPLESICGSQANIPYLIQLIDIGAPLASDSSVVFTDLDFYKAGFIFGYQPDELLDEIGWLRAFTSVRPLPILAPKSIALPQAPLIVFNDYDPIVSTERVQYITERYHQAHTLKVENAGFHAATFTKMPTRCVSDAVTAYLMDPDINRNQLPLTCDAITKTEKRYRQLKHYLDFLQLEGQKESITLGDEVEH
jgi:pimeloyl-ACP methyl ester carboxylesterase